MKFRLLGAGMMDCATVSDLARSKEVKEIVVGDYDLERAKDVSRQFGAGKAKAVFVDVGKTAALA